MQLARARGDGICLYAFVRIHVKVLEDEINAAMFGRVARRRLRRHFETTNQSKAIFTKIFSQHIM